MRESPGRVLVALFLLATLTAATPTVTLVNPEDGHLFVMPNSLTFIFQASGTQNLINATLYNDFTGSWGPGLTTTAVNNGGQTSIIVSGLGLLGPGNYTWNALVYENTNPVSSAFAPENFRFTISATEPTATPTASPTATPTATPSASPTATPTATPTTTPTATPAPTTVPGAHCSSLFLVSTLSSMNVTQGVTASYPISVRSNGVQTISLSASCDPNSLLCEFGDVPFPNLMNPGQESVFHLQVDTSRAKPGRYTILLDVSGGTTYDSCIESAVLTLDVQPSTTAAPQSPAVQAYVSPSGPQLGTPAEELLYTFGLVNQGTEPAIVNLFAAGNQFEESTLFEAVQVSLEPQEAKAIQVHVKLPPGTPGGDYTFAFIARWITTTKGPYDVVVPITIRVHAPTIAFQLLPDPGPICTIATGKVPAVIETQVRNNGNGKATVLALIEGPESAKEFITVEPRLFELKPGESAPIKISIKPQKTTTIAIYNYRLALKNLQFKLFDRSLCTRVDSVSDLRVETPESVNLLRTRTQAIKVNVQNEGNVEGEYALDVSGPSGVIISADPASFTLLPDETKELNLVFQSTLRTPLGPGSVTLTIRPRFATAVNAQFPLDIVSSNQSGESYLRLDTSPNLEVVDGVQKTIDLTVTNTGPAALPQVKLELLNIPPQWYESTSRDIASGQTTTLTLVMHPVGPQRDLYPITLSLASGLESVHYPGTLAIVPAVKRLEANNVTTQTVQEAGTNREVLVSMTLRNTGNTPASDVRPVLFASSGELDEELFAVPNQELELQPGESRTVQLSIKPAVDKTGDKTSLLKLESQEGAQAVQEIRVPALQKAGVGGLPWLAIIAVVVLLIAVFTYLAKQEYIFGKTPPREGVESGGKEESTDELEKEEEEILNDIRMLKYRYMKREIDDMTYRRLTDENERELTELRTKLRELKSQAG